LGVPAGQPNTDRPIESQTRSRAGCTALTITNQLQTIAASAILHLPMSTLDYRVGNALDLSEVIDLYNASTLGERRPTADRERMAAMLRNANLVVTAWHGQRLVGLARTLTDFVYVGYLADLAVHAGYQRRGIGKGLIARTRAEMGPDSMLVLLAAPKAVEYYPHLGFSRHESAWMLRATDPFPVAPP
jgi:GNAT superfamily N-acetyltransferase